MSNHDSDEAAGADAGDHPQNTDKAGEDKSEKPSDSDKPEQADDKKSDGEQAGDKKPDDKKSGDDDKKKPSPLKNPKVKWTLIIVVSLIVIGGAIWFFHYWTVGRFQQSTNDAYLQADQVNIAPKVGGYVTQVLVVDNQQVSAGQPLARIDSRDAQAAYDKAMAQVAQAEASVVQSEAQIYQQQAQIAVAQAQLVGARRSAHYAHNEAERYAPLTEKGAQSTEQLEQMQQKRDQADSEVAVDRAQEESARRQIAILKAQVLTAKTQISQARAQVAQAASDLDATLLRSSVAGRVGDRTVRVGQYVQPGTRLMSVVPVDQMYLVANFKETQLKLMRVGQPVTITADAVSDGEFQGTVQSFAPGTGAQFAILPPQNATGNFTKIVQRVPVRIQIAPGAEVRKVLIPGLSVTVSVDTLGAKDEAKLFKDEAKATDDARERQRDAAVKRDHAVQLPGAGR